MCKDSQYVWANVYQYKLTIIHLIYTVECKEYTCPSHSKYMLMYVPHKSKPFDQS